MQQIQQKASLKLRIRTWFLAQAFYVTGLDPVCNAPTDLRSLGAATAAILATALTTAIPAPSALDLLAASAALHQFPLAALDLATAHIAVQEQREKRTDLWHSLHLEDVSSLAAMDRQERRVAQS